VLDKFNGIDGAITTIGWPIPLFVKAPLRKCLAGVAVDVEIVGVSPVWRIDETKFDT